jgi:hypothetical protein
MVKIYFGEVIPIDQVPTQRNISSPGHIEKRSRWPALANHGGGRKPFDRVHALMVTGGLGGGDHHRYGGGHLWGHQVVLFPLTTSALFANPLKTMLVGVLVVAFASSRRWAAPENPMTVGVLGVGASSTRRWAAPEKDIGVGPYVPGRFRRRQPSFLFKIDSYALLGESQEAAHPDYSQFLGMSVHPGAGYLQLVFHLVGGQQNPFWGLHLALLRNQLW